MKKASSIVLIICLALLFCGCVSGNNDTAPEKDSTVVEEQEPLIFADYGIDQTGYESLDELVENTPVDGIKAVLKAFPADKFSDLAFFTTYYAYDDDRNFPVSAIAFKHNGEQYFFAGAERDDVFVQYESETENLWYSAIDGSNQALVPVADGECRFFSIHYPDNYDDFTLAAENRQSPRALFETLSVVTGSEYVCTDDGTAYIDETTNNLIVNLISYELGDADYRINGDDFLLELSCEYEPGEGGVVTFTDDPDEAGADWVVYPSALRLEFQMVEEGQATIEIPGEDGGVVYSVDVVMDAEMGAYIKTFIDLPG